MPSPLETDLMINFLGDRLGAITDAGRYPLVTYFGPVDKSGLEAKHDSGQHLKVAAIASRRGIPQNAWPLHLLNLHEKCDNATLLAEGAWRQNWNGVWIHQSHGTPGVVLVNGEKDGASFYQHYARHIVDADGFEYGLIKTCYGAQKPLGNNTKSLIAGIAEAALNTQIRLYATQTPTWIPLDGPMFGEPLITPPSFFDLCGEEPQPDDPYDSTQLARYYTGDIKLLKSCIAPNGLLDLLIPYLTEAYYERARFWLPYARPLVYRNPIGYGDITWYGTFSD